MKRSTLDKIISSTGLVIAVCLLLLAGALFWGQKFIHDQVTEQLTAQKITFPQAGSEQIESLGDADREQVALYAGKQLTTGAQAEVFANHYINAHLQKIGGGKTYSELSAASMANTDDSILAGKVQTVFRGETLRGLLLNAYAFDTMAMVAGLVAWGALIGSALLLFLSILGFQHAGSFKRK